MIIKRTNIEILGNSEFLIFMESNSLILDLKYTEEDIVGYIFSVYGQLVTFEPGSKGQPEIEIMARGKTDVEVVEKLADILASAEAIGIRHSVFGFKYKK